MTKRSATHLIIGLVVIAQPCGCAWWKQYPTRVDLRLMASGGLNPDLEGRPSPVVVRLIELRSARVFENADFLALFNHQRETLAQDYISYEEFDLKPGEIRDLHLQLGDEGRALAILAAYRDLRSTQWRHVVTVEPNKLTRLALALDQQGIQVQTPPVVKR